MGEEGIVLRVNSYLTILILSFPLTLNLLHPASTTAEYDYSIYNPEWNGCSTLKSIIEGEGYHVRTVISTVHFLSRLKGSAVLVIIGPSTRITYSEAEAIVEFIRRGGSLLLADKGGLSNMLARMLGFSFNGAPLLDVGSYTKNPNYPVVALTETHNISYGVDYIVLNHPTGLHREALPEDLYGVVIVARSSSASWLDENHNERWDVGEEEGSFIPVVIAFNFGNGRVVLVSDPTVFTNDMIRYGGNLAFAKNTIRWLSYGNIEFPVIFDVTHIAGLPEEPRLLAWALSLVTPWMTVLGPAFIAFLSILLSLSATKFPHLKGREEIHILPRSIFEHRMAVMNRPWALHYLYRAFLRRLRGRLNLPPSADLRLIMAKVRETYPSKEAHKVRRLLRELENLTSPLRSLEPPWKRRYTLGPTFSPLELYIAGEITYEDMKAMGSRYKLVDLSTPYIGRERFINLVRRLNILSEELGL